jgi:hypothetical protein
MAFRACGCVFTGFGIGAFFPFFRGIQVATGTQVIVLQFLGKNRIAFSFGVFKHRGYGIVLSVAA